MSRPLSESWNRRPPMAPTDQWRSRSTLSAGVDNQTVRPFGASIPSMPFPQLGPNVANQRFLGSVNPSSGPSSAPNASQAINYGNNGSIGPNSDLMFDTNRPVYSTSDAMNLSRIYDNMNAEDINQLMNVSLDGNRGSDQPKSGSSESAVRLSDSTPKTMNELIAEMKTFTEKVRVKKKTRKDVEKQINELEEELKTKMITRDRLKTYKTELESEEELLEQKIQSVLKEMENRNKRDQLSSKGDQLPSNRDQLPSNRDQLPSNRDQLPSNRGQLSSKGDQFPTKGHQLSLNRNQLSSKRNSDLGSVVRKSVPNSSQSKSGSNVMKPALKRPNTISSQMSSPKKVKTITEKTHSRDNTHKEISKNVKFSKPFETPKPNPISPKVNRRQQTPFAPQVTSGVRTSKPVRPSCSRANRLFATKGNDQLIADSSRPKAFGSDDEDYGTEPVEEVEYIEDPGIRSERETNVQKKANSKAVYQSSSSSLEAPEEHNTCNTIDENVLNTPIAHTVHRTPIPHTVDRTPTAPTANRTPNEPTVDRTPIAPTVDRRPIAPTANRTPIAPTVDRTSITPTVNAISNSQLKYYRTNTEYEQTVHYTIGSFKAISGPKSKTSQMIITMKSFKDYLFVAFNDCSVRRYHINDKNLMVRLEGHEGSVFSMIITQHIDSSDTYILYTSGKDKKLRAFNAISCRLLMTIDMNCEIYCLDFNWGHVFCGLNNGTVCKVLPSFEDNTNIVKEFVVNQNKRISTIISVQVFNPLDSSVEPLIAVSSNRIQIINTSDSVKDGDRVIHSFVGSFADPIFSRAFDKYLFISYKCRTFKNEDKNSSKEHKSRVLIYDMQRDWQPYRVIDVSGVIHGLDLIKDNLIIASFDGKIQCIDCSKLELKWITFSPRVMAFSLIGTRLVLGDNEGRVDVICLDQPMVDCQTCGVTFARDRDYEEHVKLEHSDEDSMVC